MSDCAYLTSLRVLVWQITVTTNLISLHNPKLRCDILVAVTVKL
jgi:hypothetical protein